MKKRNDFLIFILMIGVFGIINTEMGLIGILPVIAQLFNVSVATAGLLISCFALGVAISGPTLPLLFSNVDRKKAMLLALSIFCLSNVVSIFTHDFTILLLARIVPAFFQPVYVSMAFTLASQTAEPARKQQTVAKIFIGVSAGMVLGVPLTSFIANNFSYRLAMAFFALVNGVVLLLTLFFIPSLPVQKKVGYKSQLSVLKTPLMLSSIIAVVGANAAVFGFYSYLSEFLSSVSHLSSNIVSMLLLVYGIANIIGNIIAGNTLSVAPKKTIAIVLIIAFFSYFGLFLAGQSSFVTLSLILVIGIVAGLIANINQYLINAAAPEASDLANGVFLTATNLGTTIGTMICGSLLSLFGTSFTLLGTLGSIIFSAIVLSVRQKFLLEYDR